MRRIVDIHLSALLPFVRSMLLAAKKSDKKLIESREESAHQA